MRILLTGATGFAGGWLAEGLLAEGTHQLFGLSRSGQWPAELRHFEGRITLHQGDLSDGGRVEAILRAVQPERLFHLAGYPHVGRSFQEPDAAWQGNLDATRKLYEAVLRWGGRPRILAVGSGQVYGEPERPDDVLDETCPLRPGSPYASSKAAADLVGYQFWHSHSLDVVRAGHSTTSVRVSRPSSPSPTSLVNLRRSNKAGGRPCWKRATSAPTAT